MANDVNQKAGASNSYSDLLALAISGHFEKEAAKHASPVATQVAVSHLPQDRTEQQATPTGISHAEFMRSNSALGITNGKALLIVAGLLGALLVVRKR